MKLCLVSGPDRIGPENVQVAYIFFLLLLLLLSFFVFPFILDYKVCLEPVSVTAQ